MRIMTGLLIVGVAYVVLMALLPASNETASSLAVPVRWRRVAGVDLFLCCTDLPSGDGRQTAGQETLNAPSRGGILRNSQ